MMTAPTHFDSRRKTGAAAGQGRAASTAPKARTLDAADPSAGYNRAGKIDFAHIKRVVSLAMVLSRYGYLSQLKRVGSQLAGPCPIHDGSGREFVVHLASNNWHCFGACNRGGGVLDFVALREAVPIADAAQRIVQWFALSSSSHTSQSRNQARRPAMTSRPSHSVYVVENPEPVDAADQQKGFWTRIGSAWPHRDGKGLNVVLNALPIGNRMVLRENTDDDPEPAKASKRKA